jgi:spore germination protein KA
MSPNIKIENNNQKKPLYINLHENTRCIQESLGNSSDIIIRTINIGKDRGIKACVIFIDGLSNDASINEFVLESLLNNNDFKSNAPFHTIKELVISVGELKEVSDIETLLTGVLSGDPAILIDGYASGYLVGLKGWEERGVQEPSAQTVIRGPREAFSENIRFNTALVRRKIKDLTFGWKNSRLEVLPKQCVLSCIFME